MIQQQLSKNTSSFGAALNNYSTLKRGIIFTGVILVVCVLLFVKQADIASFFFSSLPIGLGIPYAFTVPLLIIFFLGLSCAAYFGILGPNNFGILGANNIVPSQLQNTNNASLISELRIKLVFGACFGLLTAILCSLIFVIAEPYLPQSFLKFHQIFSSLNFALITLAAVISCILYLGALVLPLSLVVLRLSDEGVCKSPIKLTARIITIASLISSLFIALAIIAITTSLSINLIIFCVVIFAITFAALGLLYWFVGIEASLMANIVYCLLVSYLAHIFL